MINISDIYKLFIHYFFFKKRGRTKQKLIKEVT